LGTEPAGTLPRRGSATQTRAPTLDALTLAVGCATYSLRQHAIRHNPARQGKQGGPEDLSGEAQMTSSSETGQVTGTKDKDYNIIWFIEACLSNALRLETYIQDAEREGDAELADFFRRAQVESRKGAEQGKQLLRSRLGS
jgi:hypothetical protein